MALPISHDDLQRLSDAELVAFAREQSPLDPVARESAKRAVALVCLRHSGALRAQCAAKANRKDVDDLEILVFERFVKVVYTKTEPMTNPGGMLHVMAQRVIANHHDRKAPDHASLDAVADHGALDGGYDQLAGDEYVESLLGQLTEKQRAVVVMKACEGRPSSEIAEHLGTSPGNVDVMYHRAKTFLQGVAEP